MKLWFDKLRHSKRHKAILLSALALIVVASVILPAVVLAQRNATEIEGLYIFRGPGGARYYDMDGVRYTDGPLWMMLDIWHQDEEVVQGTLYAIERPNVKGSIAFGGTAPVDARRNRQGLVANANTVVTLDTGTITVRLPVGVFGAAYNGVEGEVTGGSMVLEAGDNEVTITKAGDIEVWIFMVNEEIGSMVGVVGYGTGSRFLLYGPDMTTGVVPLESGGITITDLPHPYEHVSWGEFWRAIPPGAQYTVSGAGEFGVYMPDGITGTVSGSDGLEIDGEDEADLEPGYNGPFDTGITTGVLHVNVAATCSYLFQGRATVTRAGVVVLRGHFEGMVITDRDPWNAIIASGRVGTRDSGWVIGD